MKTIAIPNRVIYIILGLFLVVFLGLSFLFFQKMALDEGTNTRIVEKVVKSDGKVIARYKVAELIEKQPGKEMDILEGLVIAMSADPSDPNSVMMVGIKMGNERIVVSNIYYIRSLQYMYFGNKVRLKGRWKKDAVIHGSRYRCFRIEDIELVSK